MKTATLLVFLCSFLCLSGQNTMTTQAVEMKAMQRYESMALKNKTVGISTQPYNDIDGSPYYYDKKCTATLIQHNGDSIHGIPLQLDLYAGEFVYTNSEGEELFLESKYFREIRIQNESTRDVFRRAFPQQPNKFSIIEFEGDGFMVIRDPLVKLVEMSMIVAGQRQNTSRFEKGTSYFLVEGEQHRELTLKKKKFFKAFNKEEQKKMMDYAKENGFKFEKNSDFFKLISFVKSAE